MDTPHSQPHILGGGEPQNSWLHTEGSIQPHHLPIDHGVLSQGLDEVRVFGRVAQAGGKRHLLAQEIPNPFR